MKKLALIISIFLTGCFNDTSDLRVYITNIQNYTDSVPESIKNNTLVDHVNYSSQTLRNPFKIPATEVSDEQTQSITACLKPNFIRNKQPLEKYKLSDLVMRGTLGKADMTWALVEASDKVLYRISINNYAGLNHGRVVSVNQDSVKIIELIPEGSGCWVERERKIILTQQNVNG